MSAGLSSAQIHKKFMNSYMTCVPFSRRLECPFTVDISFSKLSLLIEDLIQITCLKDISHFSSNHKRNRDKSLEQGYKAPAKISLIISGSCSK